MIISARLAEHYNSYELEQMIHEIMNSWTNSFEISVGMDEYQQLIVLPAAKDSEQIQVSIKLVDLLHALVIGEKRRATHY